MHAISQVHHKNCLVEQNPEIPKNLTHMDIYIYIYMQMQHTHMQEGGREREDYNYWWYRARSSPCRPTFVKADGWIKTRMNQHLAKYHSDWMFVDRLK